MHRSNTDSASNPIVLQLKGVKKSYKGASKPALQSLTLHLRRNEILGFLGPNGAGKTTTISIIAGLNYPDSGHIKFAEMPDTATRKNRIAIVPQDIAVFEKLTARENLLYFGRLYGIAQKRLNQQVQHSIDVMRLSDHESKRICQLSGGLKRRINIAVALLNNPSILLLDEPMTGIDAQAKRMIAEELKNFAASGTAIIYTSHNMVEVQQICDRVCIMDEGKIICTGTPTNLLKDHPDCNNLEELFIKLTGHALRD